MAKLLFSLDGNLLGEYPLDKPLLRIGRRRDNDIAIDNLMISSEHAQVMAIGQNALLQDLDSTNGTMVNGVRIKQHVLQHGDIITLAHYQLRYWDEVASPRYPAPVETVAMPPESETSPMAVSEVSGDQKVPAATCSGRLYVISGPDFGKDMVLKQPLTPIGDSASPVALIRQDGEVYRIQPLEDGVSLTVNGRLLADQHAGGGDLALQDHDLIAFDGVKMEFYLAADDA